MTGNERYDVIVVGAGPAGSMAARYAAAGGRSVCLVERKETAGLPVRCGEGVGVKGIRRSLEPKPGWIRGRISRIRMVSPSNIVVDLASKDEGIILDRARMEEDLVHEAIEAGVVYRNRTPVVRVEAGEGTRRCVSADGRIFESPCLILADGVEARLARFCGWNTALGLHDLDTCAIARVRSPAIEQDRCVFYFGRKRAPGGYVWVFPRGDGEANVGLGVVGSASSAGLARRLLDAFIAERFPGCTATDIHSGGVPLTRWTRPLVRGGVMLVGDAARQVNAVHGGGISYALLAGRTAGTIAAEAFAGGRFDAGHLRKYQRWWAADCGRQQMRSFALKDVIIGFDDAFLDTIARHFAGRDPSRITHVNVFMRALASRPLLMLKALLLFR